MHSPWGQQAPPLDPPWKCPARGVAQTNQLRSGNLHWLTLKGMEQVVEHADAPCAPEAFPDA
eukprot:3562190-Lingulodinium_polyedra.AAC.1